MKTKQEAALKACHVQIETNGEDEDVVLRPFGSRWQSGSFDEEEEANLEVEGGEERAQDKGIGGVEEGEKGEGKASVERESCGGVGVLSPLAEAKKQNTSGYADLSSASFSGLLGQS